MSYDNNAVMLDTSAKTTNTDGGVETSGRANKICEADTQLHGHRRNTCKLNLCMMKELRVSVVAIATLTSHLCVKTFNRTDNLETMTRTCCGRRCV